MNETTFLPDTYTNETFAQDAFPAEFFSRFLRGEPIDSIDLEEPWKSLLEEIRCRPSNNRVDLFMERIREHSDAEDLLKAVFARDPNIQPQANPYTTQTKVLAQALAPWRRIPFVVKNAIPGRSLNIIYGWEASLKTMLLLDLSFCVALGKPWLPCAVDQAGQHGFEVNPTSVLWVDVDNGEDVLAERLAAFARAYVAPHSTPFHWMSFPDPPICASKSLATLITHAQELGVGLICIDNLLRIAGVKDENSSEMDVVMRNLRQLAEKTGAAVTIIHHRTKDSQRRESQTIRGHSSIAAAPDYIFLVRREDSGETIEVANTKARRRPVEPFSACFKYELEADGETLKTARFFRTPARLLQVSTDKKWPKLAEILKSHSNEGMNQTNLFKAIGGRKNIFLQTLKEAVQSGEIREEQGTHGSKLYFLCQ